MEPISQRVSHSERYSPRISRQYTINTLGESSTAHFECCANRFSNVTATTNELVFVRFVCSYISYAWVSDGLKMASIRVILMIREFSDDFLEDLALLSSVVVLSLRHFIRARAARDGVS